MKKSILVIFIMLALTGCIQQGLPNSVQYDAEVFVYFEGINADAGVEFDTNVFECTDGFVYNSADTTTSIGECDPTIKARIIATRTV